MELEKTFVFTAAEKKNGSSQENENPLDLETALTQLQQYKTELNSVKNKLSVYDLAKWSRHTTKMDPASQVIRDINSNIHPLPFCSNAWCKFYELMVTLRLTDYIEQCSNLNSVHLCEAPGGFICALNHFIRQKFGEDYRHGWLANTLNPYHEENDLNQLIPDDRLIRLTVGNWLYGIDNTGDLLKFENIKNITETVRQNLTDVKLVTADGSMDCQLNPSEQESLVYPLIISEVYTALTVLTERGVAVFKMFTMFEQHTLSLLYFLYVSFEQLIVHKPFTSKPGNSEVYVVCMNRKSTDNQIMEQLKLALIDKTQHVIPLSTIPAAYIRQHLKCCEYFKMKQEFTISINMQTYNDPHAVEFYQRMNNTDDIGSNYVRFLELRRIPDNLTLDQIYKTRLQIPGSADSHSITNPTNSHRYWKNKDLWKSRKRRCSGTFRERCEKEQGPKLEEIIKEIDNWSYKEILTQVFRECLCQIPDSPIDTVHKLRPVYTVCHQINRVVNSVFCNADLLVKYNTLSIQHTQENISTTAHIPTGVTPSYTLSADNLTSHTILDMFTHHIKPCQHLLLTGTIPLTRLQANVIFLLWHCFDEVCVVGFNENKTADLMFKTCIITNIKQFVEILVGKLHVTSTHNNNQLIELFITDTLTLCENYMKFITDLNNTCLHRRIHAHILKQKATNL